MSRTDNVHIAGLDALVTPNELKRESPLSDAGADLVLRSREQINRILAGEDHRLLVIAGPCSIHDPAAAMDYARRLAELHQRLADRLFIVMRVYFEKPRTTVGWKGLINDPHLDGSFDIQTGLKLARKLLLDILELGLPTGSEVLDPITPQYISDLLAWASIGARTTESQTHRQMASGLSMPVGYKNSTEGNLTIAADAMQSAQHPHSFLGIDGDGNTVVVRTTGNPWGHLILRGGRGATNYDPATVAEAAQVLRERGLPDRIVVDCSHANAQKKYQNQELVWRSLLQQRQAGETPVTGLLLESNLYEGAQKLGAVPAELRYGVSITDECVGWDKTVELLTEAYDSLG